MPHMNLPGLARSESKFLHIDCQAFAHVYDCEQSEDGRDNRYELTKSLHQKA